MTYKEFPSINNLSKIEAVASTRAPQRQHFCFINVTTYPTWESCIVALTWIIPPILTVPVLPITLPSKVSFKKPDGGSDCLGKEGIMVWEENATSSYLLIIVSFDIFLNWGRKDSLAKTKFFLVLQSCSLEDFTSKPAHVFFSVQMTQMIARKASFHVILPLGEPTNIFQASSRQYRVLGKP